MSAHDVFFVQSPISPSFLKVELYTKLRKTPRNDRQGSQPGRAEGLLILVADARVENVVDIDRDVQPPLLEWHHLRNPDVELIEARVIELSRLDDVHDRHSRVT